MTRRIFIQFRTDRVPGEPAKKPILVATAACLKLLNRSFDFERDFLHAQGEILEERARCHVLVDCDYRESEPDLKNADLRCYRVVEGEHSFTLVETNVHRGLIDTIPWGKHSF